MFAMAHPAMLRRLWFGVWDSTAPDIARSMVDARYGAPPFDCATSDLPEQITTCYLFPYVDGGAHWIRWESALSWSSTTFRRLGLLP